MDYIDKYKDFISDEKEFLDSLPKKMTLEQTNTAQEKLDAIRANRPIDDRHIAKTFLREARVDFARAKLHSKIREK